MCIIPCERCQTNSCPSNLTAPMPPSLLIILSAFRPVLESFKAVARRLGRHRGIVESWVRCFNRHGLNGLKPTFQGQPGAILSPDELAQLQQTITQPPRKAGLKTGIWTGKVVRAFVTRRLGKSISAATARRYLHRLGFRRKRPRKRLVKANPAAQQAFAQALQHREQHRAPGSVTVYMDQGQIWQDA